MDGWSFIRVRLVDENCDIRILSQHIFAGLYSIFLDLPYPTGSSIARNHY
jgi:hypothetical protein